jgi:hypothetical protein
MEDQGLNPMDFKTASAYLEYILQSEGEIMWMHFDEAQRIESTAKDEAFEEGFQSGFNASIGLIKEKINIIEINFQENEQ